MFTIKRTKHVSYIRKKIQYKTNQKWESVIDFVEVSMLFDLF